MSDTTQYIVQAIALVLVFSAKVVEKWRTSDSDAAKTRAEHLYWSILSLGLVIALSTEFCKAYDKRVSQELQAEVKAIQEVADRAFQARAQELEATRSLDDAFELVRNDPSAFNALNDPVRKIEDARKALLPYSYRQEIVVPLIRATQGLGAGQERLAYGSIGEGRRYFLDQHNRLKSCQALNQSRMGRTVRSMKHRGVVRCTNFDMERWREARETMITLQSLLMRTKDGAIEGDPAIPSAARTVGYFHLCDYLRNQEVDALQRAKEAWELYDRTTPDKKYPGNPIYDDMAKKIRVLISIEALGDPSHKSLSQKGGCPKDIDD